MLFYGTGNERNLNLHGLINKEYLLSDIFKILFLFNELEQFYLSLQTWIKIYQSNFMFMRLAFTWAETDEKHSWAFLSFATLRSFRRSSETNFRCCDDVP